MHRIDVLDHGYVKLRNLAGPVRRVDQPFDASDTDVANSARMSFDASDEERTLEDELRLTTYLYNNLHMTPFENIVVWLEMKLPIFLARQFVRHRTARINEVSGRYVQLPEEWYIPEVVGGKPEGGAKQGQDDTLPPYVQDRFKRMLNEVCQTSYRSYENLLANGVAPEHARLFLHLNHYTHWMYQMDLRNLLNFLKLRMDSHAQVEAQVYARAIFKLLEAHLPNLMEIVDEST